MTAEAIVNQVSAMCLLLADEQARAVEQASGLNSGAAAALVVIGHAPNKNIDFLRRVLRRSHSAVVRLVASLTDRDLLERHHAEDKRALALTLSERGTALCQDALKARQRTMADRLAVLTPRELRTLQRISGKLLTSAATDEVTALQVCRLCDAQACDDCPVEAGLDDDPLV